MPPDTEFLGEFFVRNLCGTAIRCVDGLCREQFDSPGHREYQVMLRSLSEEQKEILRKVVKYCVEGALNDTLYRLDEELNKKKPKLEILVDGAPLATPGSPSKLHSQLWGPEGWLNRYRGSDTV